MWHFADWNGETREAAADACADGFKYRLFACPALKEGVCVLFRMKAFQVRDLLFSEEPPGDIRIGAIRIDALDVDADGRGAGHSDDRAVIGMRHIELEIARFQRRLAVLAVDELNGLRGRAR